MQLFDPYSILVMIATAEQCKTQMTEFYRLRVLIGFLEKLLIFCLWPRFSQVFDIHLTQITNCDAKVFRLNQQSSLHVETTVRMYQFLSGILRLQEICKFEQLMVTQKLARIVKGCLSLMSKMAEEHFVTAKDKTLFKVNNLDFVVQQFAQHGLKKDTTIFAKALEIEMESLIDWYFRQNFEDLFKLTTQF